MQVIESGFFGRLYGFWETFGALGVFLVIIVASVIITVALWRGPGLMLFVLFMTYATGAISYGGILFLSTLVRWLFIGLLGFMLFRSRFSMRYTMVFVFFYLLMGALGNLQSPNPLWTVQQTILLTATIIFTPLAINAYVFDFDKIIRIFKFGIVAATVWTISNMLFISEFKEASELRFTGAGEKGSVALAYAGAFFAPMIVWGMVQNRYKFWRLYSILLIIPFLLILLASGVRSALFGMAFIAPVPILFVKFRLSKLIIGLGVLCALLTITIYGLFIFFPGKADMLYERIFSTSTTGRYEIWVIAISKCMSEAIFGHGCGSAEIVGRTEFGVFFHNAYLQVWYNSGILGLVAIVIFIAIYIFRSLRLLYVKPVTEIREFAGVANGYMLGIAAMGMFEGVFATAGGVGIFMLMVITTMIDRLDQMNNEMVFTELYESTDMDSSDMNFYGDEIYA